MSAPSEPEHALIAESVRDVADRLADYMLTRSHPWADEAVMREAVLETVRLLAGDARYEMISLLNDGADDAR